MSDCLFKIFDFKADSMALLELLREKPFAFFLDSSTLDKTLGRFSFIGFDPFEVFRHRGKQSLSALKKRFLPYADKDAGFFVPEPTPFSHGIMGYLGYDLGLHWEEILFQAKDDLIVPECLFGFYDCVITLDHFRKKMIISSSGLPEKTRALREKRAQSRLKRILKILSNLRSLPSRSLCIPGKILGQDAVSADIKSNFTKDAYLKAIKKILGYIRGGDVYQVNLSQRFEWPSPTSQDPLGLYRRLRRLSPSPFGGYLDCGGFQIISSSPERFIKLENALLETRPMKGTRPRGRTPLEDRKKRRELLKSPKEKAELLMITDLERNDLGRVCNYGSIRVKVLRTLENYETVFQTTSTIEGRLKKGQDGFDVLRACFPGGSVTGCPKIRAMEIIEDLEPAHRGIYTGSLGYMNFKGDMDFNILIRTLLKYREKIYFQTGGGIVADSIPEEEYEETLVKAKALKMCLQGQ